MEHDASLDFLPPPPPPATADADDTLPADVSLPPPPPAAMKPAVAPRRRSSATSATSSEDGGDPSPALSPPGGPSSAIAATLASAAAAAVNAKLKPPPVSLPSKSVSSDNALRDVDAHTHFALPIKVKPQSNDASSALPLIEVRSTRSNSQPMPPPGPPSPPPRARRSTVSEISPIDSKINASSQPPLPVSLPQRSENAGFNGPTVPPPPPPQVRISELPVKQSSTQDNFSSPTMPKKEKDWARGDSACVVDEPGVDYDLASPTKTVQESAYQLATAPEGSSISASGRAVDSAGYQLAKPLDEESPYELPATFGDPGYAGSSSTDSGYGATGAYQLATASESAYADPSDLRDPQASAASDYDPATLPRTTVGSDYDVSTLPAHADDTIDDGYAELPAKSPAYRDDGYNLVDGVDVEDEVMPGWIQSTSTGNDDRPLVPTSPRPASWVMSDTPPMGRMELRRTSQGGVLKEHMKEGYLGVVRKTTRRSLSSRTSYKPLYVVLSTLDLSFYSSGDLKKAKVKSPAVAFSDVIDVTGTESDSKVLCIHLRGDRTMVNLQAGSSAERDEWFQAVRQAVLAWRQSI